MAVLPIVIAPNKIFSEKADDISTVNDEVRKLLDDMKDTMYYHGAVGIAGNMVGIKKKIVVIDLGKEEVKKPIFMVNPKIIEKSNEKQKFTEASLSYPFISADITRPKDIKVEFLDYDGKKQTIEASEFLSTVIQHEVDYLDGKVYLDYLSKLKKDILIKKMMKMVRSQPDNNN